MKNLINDFFFKTNKFENNDFLGYYRISIGIFCLLHYLSVLGDFSLLYGNSGFIPADINSLFKIFWIPSFGELAILVQEHLYITESVFSLYFHIIFIVSCLLLTIGFFSKPAAIIILIIHLILAKGTYLYAYGVDYFTTISLFYCLIFPVHKVFSLDSLIFTYKKINPLPFRRVLQIHLCFVYFFSGFDKLIGYNWRNGEAVWKALHLPYFQSDLGINFDFLAYFPFIFVLMGWGVIIIEMLYTFFIFHPRTRSTWLILTIMLHLGIMIMLNLYFFASIMIILNIAAFADFKNKDHHVVENNPKIAV